MRIIVAGVALVLALISPAHAADLYVAGTIGEVYKGDSQTGGLAPWGAACLGPIQALVMTEDYVAAGDAVGAVLRFDRLTGDHLGTILAPGDITAMVMDGEDLLIGTNGQNVYRVNPMTGDVLATLPSPIDIQAMALDGSDLFIAGTIGEVYMGSSQTGGFEQWAGVCLGPIHALTLGATELYAGDLTGAVLRFDLATASHTGTFWAGSGVTALVMDGDDLLVSEYSGTIYRTNPSTGTVIGTLTSPITVEAMEIDPDGAVDAPESMPVTAALTVARPQPNPFMSGTTFSYSTPSAATVTLMVLNVQGRPVATVVDGWQNAGEHAVSWDGRDDRGSRVATGVYFARLEVDGEVKHQKIVMAR